MAGDIKEQARDVLGEARSEFRQQAESGTKRAAEGIRTLGGQIEALRDGRPADAGPIAGYADQARRKMEDVATRLDQGGLDGMIADVSRFARRRPGLFLLACTGAGFAVARLARTQADSDRRAVRRRVRSALHRWRRRRRPGCRSDSTSGRRRPHERAVVAAQRGPGDRAQAAGPDARRALR